MIIRPAIVQLGLVVKPLGLTVKKEACDVVKTLGWKNVVKSQATKDFQKRSPKKGPLSFLIFKFVRF
jgi:hypothetical protein